MVVDVASAFAIRCAACCLCSIITFFVQFPILFKAVDAAKTEELDTVPSSKFKAVADACTLCDMCFTSKCPYTPPHEFDLDFPHLILRYRALEEAKQNKAVATKHFGGLNNEWKDYHKPVPPASVQAGVSRELEKNPSSFAHLIYSSQDIVVRNFSCCCWFVLLFGTRDLSLQELPRF
jgi:hypothetical protein